MIELNIKLLNLIFNNSREFASIYKFSLLPVSAIIFALSLIYPAQLYFLVFVFLVPIFYLAFRYPDYLSFKHGFFWGLTFFVIHFFGYIFMFNNQAYGSFRLLIPVFLAAYCALYSGAWFFLVNLFVNYSHVNYFHVKNSCVNNSCSRPISTFCSWVIFTYLYFSWIKYGAFWILGRFFGYPFSQPLLPLATCPDVLYFLPVLGKSALLVFIVFFSLFIALFIVCFKSKYLIFALICLGPFVVGQFLNKHQDCKEQNQYLDTIGYINPLKAQTLEGPMDQAQEIYYQMVELLKKNPKITTIIMPESSCQFCLNINKYVIDLWASNILGDSVDLLIGAPYQESLDGQNSVKTYNCLYHISHGNIKKVYKKTSLMPFAEYVPFFWNNFEFCKKLFFQDSCPGFSDMSSCGKACMSSLGFACGCDKKVCFNCGKNIVFRPLICSDFFTIKRRDIKAFSGKSSFVLLVAINDSIFPMQYLRDLMLLHAKVEAISIERDILYVGYYFACLISKCGQMRPITRGFCCL